MALSLDVSRAVVGGSFGELTVTFTNDSAGPIGPCRLSLDVDDRGARAGVVLVPSKPDGGYAIGAALPARASVQRRFAVKAPSVEQGRSYPVKAEASWPGGGEQIVHEVAVDPAPEFHALVDAAEGLRQTLLAACPERMQTSAAEPAPPVTELDHSTFQWALDAVESATPLYKQARRAKPRLTP